MTSHRTPPHLMTLVALTGIAALSMNIFLPSLPGMAREFGVDYAVMQLSVSAYIGVTAVLQLLAGPLSDRLGRRPVVLTGLVIFLFATVGTLLADDITSFLTFRLIQASIATCLMIPRAAVRDMYDGDKAVTMLAYVTMGMAVVPMLAPVIGGILDEAFGWRTNFAMMGGLGVIVLLVAWHDMGETVREGGVPLKEQLQNYPVLARSVRFWGYCGAATLCSGTFYAYLGGAPFVGEYVFHLSPAQVGYFFAAPSVGYIVGNAISSRWSARLGMNRMILWGSAICLVAPLIALLVEISGQNHPLIFFGAVTIIGIGNGMVMPNANTGIMNVRPLLAGTAAGLGGAMTIAGGAIMAALAGAILTPGSGDDRLLILIAASAAGSVLSIIWVMRREATLMRTG